MKERLKELWLYLKEKKLYFLFFVIFLLLGGLIFSLSAKKAQKLRLVTPSPTLAPRESGSLPPETTTSPQPPPQIFFETYENRASLPQVPEAVNIYTLKTNYTFEEVLAFGKKLGLTQYKEEGSFVVLYNLDNINNRGILTFNKETGGFSFQSWGVTRGLTASTNPQTTTLNFLTNLGVIDDTVSCEITYQRKELPDVIFVECHRDWAKVGLPILNFVGVLNIPENKPLSSLTLGGVDENMPNDNSIINTSTGEDGKIRPNDFNTATVAVSSDGRILSVESNLRQIVQTTTHSSSDLLTPQEALNQFLAHKSQFSLTIPAGSGTVAWNKVYPDNKASAKKAVITDYILTYLEKPSSVTQDKLVPMYEIRGITQLSSGYRVRFIEMVSALHNSPSPFAYSQQKGIMAGESTANLLAENNTLKLGTFEPPITQPTVTLTMAITPTTTATRLPCPISADTLNPIYDIPELGKIGVFIHRGGIAPFLIFYYIPTQDQLSVDITLDRIYDEVRRLEKGIGIGGEFGPRPTILAGNTKLRDLLYGNRWCPFPLTSDSPSLYLYPVKESQVKVNILSTRAYADPPVKDNSWELKVYPDGSLISAHNPHYHILQYSRLYYEYDKSKVTFPEPKEGFVVERDEWEEFIREIVAPQLGLKEREAEDLVVDVRNALVDIENKDYQYLKISFIDRKELDERLPITISPQPNIFHRVHLLLTPLESYQEVDQPKLNQLPRKGFTVVEVGAGIR